MDTVWIRTHDDTLIRAKSITTLQNWRDGLYAECINRQRVQSTNGACSVSSQLALLEEIRQAGADDSGAVVIMPVWKQNSLSWHREFADALADQLNKYEHKDSRISSVPDKYVG
jgi:hypothetical protein